MSRLQPHLPLLLVLVLVAPLHLAWSWGEEIGQLGNDGADYLTMAHHYAHDSLDDALYSGAAASSRFPPLYPLLLAWTHASVDLRWVHAVTTLFLLAALLVFYTWQIAEGLPPIQAAGLVLLLALLPQTWLTGLSVQSEYPYLFFSLASLCLMSAFRRRGQIPVLYSAAIMTALAALTRTAGIALYAPLLLVLWHAPRRAALLAAAAAALPLALWHILHQAQLGYGSALGNAYGSGFLRGLYAQLSAELPALRNGFADNFLIGNGFRGIADGLALACLAGAARRAGRLEPDGIYLAAYLLLLSLWPFPEEAPRLLWVVLPIALGQVLLLAHRRPPGAMIRRPSALAAPLLIAAASLMAAPSLAYMAERYTAAGTSAVPGAWGFISWYGPDSGKAQESVAIQSTLVDALRRIQALVPQDDCVLSVRPEWILYYAHRKGGFPPLNSMPEPYFHNSIHNSGCHFVFAVASTTARSPLPMFPMDRIGNEVDTVSYCGLPSDSPGQIRLLCVLARLK